MMTDGPLQVITDVDRGTDYEVRVHEVFELQLPAKPISGHVWEIIDQPNEIAIESWRWEPDTDPYEAGASGSDTFRIWRIHTTEPGTFELRLRCWKPWEGEESVADSFEVMIEAT